MKLRLIFWTKTKKKKDLILKFNIAPSKHIGFINFINLALSQNKPITLMLEHVDSKGDKKIIPVKAEFNLEQKTE